MWYNATASALTPPLQSIPRRCQRRGDRLLPEPICQTPGCTIARMMIAVPVQPLPVDDEYDPDTQPGCNMLLRQFVQHCKEGVIEDHDTVALQD